MGLNNLNQVVGSWRELLDPVERILLRRHIEKAEHVVQYAGCGHHLPGFHQRQPGSRRQLVRREWSGARLLLESDRGLFGPRRGWGHRHVSRRRSTTNTVILGYWRDDNSPMLFHYRDHRQRPADRLDPCTSFASRKHSRDSQSTMWGRWSASTKPMKAFGGVSSTRHRSNQTNHAAGRLRAFL